MAGITAFGEPVDLAVAGVVQLCAFNRGLAVFVELFDVFQHPAGPVRRVRVMLEIAHALTQFVFHATLVAQVFQQGVVVDDLLRAAKVALRPFCIRPEAVVAGLIVYRPGHRFIPVGVFARFRCAVDRVDLHDLSP